MKPDKHDHDLPRHLASQHLVIPPTPRDTMAVLREAASRPGKDARSRGMSLMPWWRWAGAVVLMIIAGWWRWPDAEQTTARAPANPAEIIYSADDLGLDVADWDLEFEALWEEVNDALSMLDDGLELDQPDARENLL